LSADNTGILRTFKFAPFARLAPFASLNADVLAHVLGFIAHGRWEYHMAGTTLSCVQRLNKVFFSARPRSSGAPKSRARKPK